MRGCGYARWLVVAGTVLCVSGCRERELTEADCALVKERVEQAWHRDAIAAQRLADTDGFNQFIRDEQNRIGDAFMEQCRPLVGRQVSARELDCLGKAETIDDVYACAGR
ncbi:MAG: hypothetical protein RIF41_20125 [Polyangiaceae bacterium]